MAVESPRRRINWVEIIGLVGLIASLVFVGFEIRQNTKVARAEAYRAFVTELNTWYLQWASPEQASLTARVYSSDVSADDLTREEWMQTFALQMALYRVYEGLHKEVTQGVLDESALLLLSQSEFDVPIIREMWPEASRNLTPDFVTYMEDTHGLPR
jgi:hypothetical protein